MYLANHRSVLPFTSKNEAKKIFLYFFFLISHLKGVDMDYIKYQRLNKFVSEHNMTITMYIDKYRIAVQFTS